MANDLTWMLCVNDWTSTSGPRTHVLPHHRSYFQHQDRNNFQKISSLDHRLSVSSLLQESNQQEIDPNEFECENNKSL